ncbi:hypothetical protein Tco_1032871 [Tanacetum coccineum]|uniref:Uncharacterized protein n=1 Tax=Tanacetum coccineum TaxID=301880 RepID=A0ABQ5GDN2_9ASTR
MEEQNGMKIQTVLSQTKHDLLLKSLCSGRGNDFEESFAILQLLRLESKGYSSLEINLKLDVKENKTALQCLSAEAEYVALSASVPQVMWKRPAFKIKASKTQNTVVLRLSVSHSNLMQSRTSLSYKAHPYSVSLHKGTVISDCNPAAFQNEERMSVRKDSYYPQQLINFVRTSTDLKHSVHKENSDSKLSKTSRGRSKCTERKCFDMKIDWSVRILVTTDSINASFNKSNSPDRVYKGLEIIVSKRSIHVCVNSGTYTVTSNSVPTPQESKIVKHDNVIAPGMFRINPFKPSREEKYVPNKVRASVRTNPITVSQPHVVTKKDVNSDSNGLSSTRVDNTAKTGRPQPRSNTKNDRVPSASKSSCNKNKEVEVEEHPRNLLLSKNKKHMSSECNHVKLAIQNDKSEVICAMCKQCLITANHDVYPVDSDLEVAFQKEHCDLSKS